MDIEFAGIFAWPFEIVMVVLAIIICYVAMRRLLAKSADEGERALSITLGMVGIAYTYRQVKFIGWLGIVISLLAGVLILLLGEVITEEESDEV